MNNKRISTGLIGFGLAGANFHAPFIEHHPGFRLSKVMSSRVDDIKARYPDVDVVATISEILDDKTIELVVIATPTDTHFALAKAALESGKHVVVDKPFVLNADEAKVLIALAKERKKQLFVYQNRRFDGDFMTVKKLISDKQLGSLYSFESHFDRFRPEVNVAKWREQDKPGSGLLYDLGSHLIDQALNLFGRPEWIFADITAQRPSASVDDYFHLLLGFGSFRAILHAGSVVKAQTPRFVVHGDKGSFIKYGLDPQEDRLRAGLTPDMAIGKEGEEAYGVLDVHENKQKLPTIAGDYRLFYQGVYDSIEKQASAPVSPNEALLLSEVIDAAILSAKQGRVVFLS
ncbi:MAG: oxidoreductase [Francisellaceae bacterium]